MRAAVVTRHMANMQNLLHLQEGQQLVAESDNVETPTGSALCSNAKVSKWTRVWVCWHAFVMVAVRQQQSKLSSLQCCDVVHTLRFRWSSPVITATCLACLFNRVFLALLCVPVPVCLA